MAGPHLSSLRPTSKNKRREYFTRENCTSNSLSIRTQEELAQSEELRAWQSDNGSNQPCPHWRRRRIWHVGNYVRTPANFDSKVGDRAAHTAWSHPMESGHIKRPRRSLIGSAGGVHSPCMTADARCTR